MWDFDVHNVVRPHCVLELNLFGIKGKEPGAGQWKLTMEETRILGTLYLPAGPREWSPESPLPEKFEILTEVVPTTRIWIKIDRMTTAENMKSWKTGYFGLLDPASPFWNSYKKRYGL